MIFCYRYQFAARFICFLVVPLLLPLIAGCGSGSKSASASQTRLTPVHMDILWPARTRAITAPASALSATVILKGAAADGSDFTWQINREDNMAAHTGRYTSSTLAKSGANNLHADFYAQSNGSGAVVGIIDAPVTLTAYGGGIGALATTTTFASIAAAIPPALTVGQIVQLTFTVKDADNNLLAVTPGSAVWQIMSGKDKMTLTPDGKATGMTAGTAGVQVCIDGKSSATQSVNISVGALTRGFIVFSAAPPGMASNIYGKDVYIANADGSNVRLLVHLADYPALSPDQSKVAYAGGGGLAVINTDGSNAHTLIEANFHYGIGGFAAPSFSPDGKVIIVSNQSPYANFQPPYTNLWRLFLVNVNGNSAGLYLSLSSAPQNGVFTPNGNQIVYESSDGLSISGLGGTDIRVFIAKTNLPGGLSGGPSHPVFSPDGTKLVFYTYDSTNNSGNLAVFIANADGTNIRQVPNITTGRGNPTFTQDGTGILYAGSHIAGNDGIFAINLDGTNHRLIIPQTAAYDKLDYPQSGVSRHR